MKILFLDIDGVLNGHEYVEEAQCSQIKPECVKHLNRILSETGCKIVLSSAWRYLVLQKAMTLSGFEVMLRSHGVRCISRLIGTTCFDEDKDDRYTDDRSGQIARYIASFKDPIESYAVVDDGDYGFSKCQGPRFVHTDSKVGLTKEHADRLIEILNKDRVV